MSLTYNQYKMFLDDWYENFLLITITLSTAVLCTGTTENSSSSKLVGISSVSSGVMTMPNDFASLSGLDHISNGYAAVAPTRTETTVATTTKQEIPIYEDTTITAESNKFTGNKFIPNYRKSEEKDILQHNAWFDPAEYTFLNAGATYNGEFSTSYNGVRPGNWSPTSHELNKSELEQIDMTHNKISSHFDQDISYNEQEHHLVDEQNNQENQIKESSAGESEPISYQFYDNGEPYNFPALENHAYSEHSHHTDIINYVPMTMVQKQHVPIEKPVQIPVSHAIIVPVRKPIPIHIPITKQVQVPYEKELRIPLERLVPFPIEKRIPVPIEKRIPYPLVKYLPIKVSQPFPIKVPVFKTVLHKVKSVW